MFHFLMRNIYHPTRELLIILFPYFLFTGVLVSRIKRQKDVVAAENPNVSFFDAKYLSSHPRVIDTFVERIDEILKNEDNSSPNCSLCKYRSNLFGFEKEVGLKQESHHDHVEGLGISCELCEAECSGACEIEIISSYSTNKDLLGKNISEESDFHHHHHHEIYPNAHHPLGPVTLQSANKVKH